MLKKYYKLQFYLQENSPKSWVSNISVRWCYDDGTPIRYKTCESGKGRVEAEDGDCFAHFPLFYINKWRNGYELVVHNRRERKCFYPCRFYPSLEEAFFAAREIWLGMDADLTDEDLKITDHAAMGQWVKTESIDRFLQRNKCENVRIGDSHHGKTLIWWDNYQVAI